MIVNLTQHPATPDCAPHQFGEKNMTTMTKDFAIDVLVARITHKFPTANPDAEREELAKKSRASLLHSVGAQWYGDIAAIDYPLCAYAYSKMSCEEQRGIDNGTRFFPSQHA